LYESCAPALVVAMRARLYPQLAAKLANRPCLLVFQYER
jgi:hypothetical protein